MSYTTVPEVEAAFLAYVPKGKSVASREYTLDTIRALLAYLGDPQDGLRVVHVAGTSGKTSTSYFIRGLLERAGCKTGLTVSPHIISIKERTQVGGGVLSDRVYIDYAVEFLALVERSELHPSFFEIMMCFAYWVFAKEKVEYAVIETGMGGLLDGSNVATRPDKVAVITDIGLDHTHILGKTIDAIARQKAGIVHENNQLFLIEQSADAMEPIINYAHQKHAQVAIVSAESEPALPSYQRRNWSLAKAVYSYLHKRDGLIELVQVDYNAVMQQMPPGRLEKVQYGDKLVILDGAHNPQKLQALGEALSEIGLTRLTVMASFINAPEYKLADNMTALAQFTHSLIIPEFTVVQDLLKQSPPADEMRELARRSGISSVTVQKDVRQAAKNLLECSDDVIVVTGSLYLVSQVRAVLEESD